MNTKRQGNNNPLSRLPSTSKVLESDRTQTLIGKYGQRAISELIRETLQVIRDNIHAIETDQISLDAIITTLESKAKRFDDILRPVINATGVILHTNLGRAPLSKDTQTAMLEVTNGYSNLEYDLTTGSRGSRFSHLQSIIRRLTGAEDSIVLNNNAGAILTALAAICRDGEVIVSRGQLVEIGGGFRVPDVMSQSGAQLKEVGTTNRTRSADYESGISDKTKALMRVHPSNFLISGFTEETSLQEIVKVGHDHNLPVIDDIGSGALLDLSPYGLKSEPLLSECIDDGADLVLASGDKLIGGPQAGLIIGKSSLIDTIRKHPLTRALRPDKATIAGLAATLQHYALGEAIEKIPIWQMISMNESILQQRAQQFADAWGSQAQVITGQSTVGGGSLPGQTLTTRLCAISLPQQKLELISKELRTADVPIISKIQDSMLQLDPRTVLIDQDIHVLNTLGKLSVAMQ
jgi:L-seryl-tRNA(Ser) seleniumtransferase|tara:strand:+ start:701 stop:2092 length:1392 start_codon:yes stop_codon:yes gene_type:complete